MKPQTLNDLYTPSGIVDPLGFPAYRLLLEVECEKDTFSSDTAGLVYSGIWVLEAPDSSHQVVIGVPS